MRKEISTKNTCQICARVIKSSTGVIAHHGYKRPGGGWQTSSCAGARYLPYEVSCDRLPPTIKSIEDFIASQEKRLENFVNNPPENLSISMESMMHKESKIVVRPEGFNSQNNPASYSPWSYEGEYRHQKYQIETSIKYAKSDLKFMQERLAKWIPPK